jgi:hypothetical protein
MFHSPISTCSSVHVVNAEDRLRTRNCAKFSYFLHTHLPSLGINSIWFTMATCLFIYLLFLFIYLLIYTLLQICLRLKQQRAFRCQNRKETLIMESFSAVYKFGFSPQRSANGTYLTYRYVALFFPIVILSAAYQIAFSFICYSFGG